MDIWQWVRTAHRSLQRNGHQRLASLLYELPDAVGDEQAERVDALAAEALGLARELGDAWIEIYVRHWALQSSVLSRNQVGRSLPEAVALLDFATREEHRACPQSVCVVQDLTVCYEAIDGPGYAEERMASSLETLARIDPSWPCWDCISAEYVDAVADHDEPARALALLDEYRARAFAARPDATDQAAVRASLLLTLGRPAEALAVAQGGRRLSAVGVVSLELVEAAAHLALGDADAALAVLPEVARIRGAAGRYPRWASVQVGLARAGRVPVDEALVRRVAGFARELEGNGALYKAALVLGSLAELGWLGAVPALTAAADARVTALCQRLRRPEPLLAGVRERALRPTAMAADGAATAGDGAAAVVGGAAAEHGHAPGDPSVLLEVDALAALRAIAARVAAGDTAARWAAVERRALGALGL